MKISVIEIGDTYPADAEGIIVSDRIGSFTRMVVCRPGENKIVVTGEDWNAVWGKAEEILMA